mgnify:CR=1 FL=1
MTYIAAGIFVIAMCEVVVTSLTVIDYFGKNEDKDSGLE